MPIFTKAPKVIAILSNNPFLANLTFNIKIAAAQLKVKFF